MCTLTLRARADTCASARACMHVRARRLCARERVRALALTHSRTCACAPAQKCMRTRASARAHANRKGASSVSRSAARRFQGTFNMEVWGQPAQRKTEEKPHTIFECAFGASFSRTSTLEIEGARLCKLDGVSWTLPPLSWLSPPFLFTPSPHGLPHPLLSHSPHKCK